jgi:hypothetical protein
LFSWEAQIPSVHHPVEYIMLVVMGISSKYEIENALRLLDDCIYKSIAILTYSSIARIMLVEPLDCG